ncbi:hypothetical protein, conserved [Trypanosoma brucei gambiense DAL972]|uniref:Uncharacterized protein n=1 Tax=Trypanosoma brucei gambiense (strain MHOM/CI/86/DAL972) TaxID=679716 RepID=C9ZVI6_TRYB9|nr:hypothetical protein, conserved [Trypanosoma brucei gambiense DAL972]CBH13424.1 hypothetical protein, conserved [Trypanosoma brucei gambiense DAL972]|eukprot:XP_011775701.1 hypothetical protein, conserved [Trypanosoma brucei gambiense DAL972]
MVKVEPPVQLLQRHISALPFDVLIRRIHSSALTNPSRSLEAHFLGSHSPPDRCEVVATRAVSATTSSAARTAGATATELRSLLSQRLLLDIRRYQASNQLDLDDLSLVLANAIRHRLSPELAAITLQYFADALSATGAANQEPRRIEALSRIMEACCDAELTEWTPMTWDCLATIVALIEQRWLALAATASVCALLLQFLSTVVGAQLQGKAASSGLLKTDSQLLKERCLKLADSATQALAEALESDESSRWNPGQLQGVCAVVEQLRKFENLNAHISHGSAKQMSFWKRHGTVNEPTYVWKKVRRVLTMQILTHGTLERAVWAMTLQQASELFASISTTCGADAVGKVAAPLHRMLKVVVAADLGTMGNVIRIGEASLVAEGASALLTQSIDIIGRYNYVLTGGNGWGLLIAACTLFERAPLSISPVVDRTLGALQLALEDAQWVSPDSPEFFAHSLAVASLATLLVTHKLSTTTKLESRIVDIANASPLLRDATRGPSIVVRCLFFLISTADGTNGRGKIAEKRACALGLLMAESRDLHGKKEDCGGSFHLTAFERRILRFVQKQSGVPTALHRNNNFEN